MSRCQDTLSCGYVVKVWHCGLHLSHKVDPVRWCECLSLFYRYLQTPERHSYRIHIVFLHINNTFCTITFWQFNSFPHTQAIISSCHLWHGCRLMFVSFKVSVTYTTSQSSDTFPLILHIWHCSGIKAKVSLFPLCVHGHLLISKSIGLLGFVFSMIWSRQTL